MKHLFYIRLILILTLLPLYLTAHSYRSEMKKTDTIELFSSHGCSSCPPAERWIAQFREGKSLFKTFFPLVFHIDYWDSLGWRDQFASSANTRRQRTYHQEGVSSSVYTPQFIINNQEWKGWFSPLHHQKWPKSSENPGVLEATLDSKSHQLTIIFHPTFKSDEPIQLHVSILGLGITSKIKRGKNKGRTFKDDFIVLTHQTQPYKHLTYSTTTWKLKLPTIPDLSQERSAIAIWVTLGTSQKIIQITGGYL